MRCGTIGLRLAALILAVAALLSLASATAPADAQALAAPLPAFGPPVLDFGDAPEGALAYSTGVIGGFPTCQGIGPSTWIQHGFLGNTMAWLGPAFDFELDGNAGACPGFSPYDQDECYAGSDAGLLTPDSFTIQNGLEVPCPNSQGIPLGGVCQTAIWGVNVDIQVRNNMPVPGYLNVIMDWNRNGMWGGASTCPASQTPEHVLVNWPVPIGYAGPASGLGPPPFVIGPNAGFVWARFSISEQPVGVGWDGSGYFEDGESEDYLLLIQAAHPDPYDWGDAPDPSYPTLSSHNGANHLIVQGFMLGSLIDNEADGQPDPQALGDDNDANGDDEEGVTFRTALVQGQQACVDVFLTSAGGGVGLLDAWVDFDGSGIWEHPAEQVFAALALNPGNNPNLCFTVPQSAAAGSTFVRFRLSTQGGLSPTGTATDGEVEDYGVEIVPTLTMVKNLILPVSGTAHVSDTVTFQIVITNTGVLTVTTLPLWDYYSPACLENPQATPPASGSGTNATLGILHWSNLGPLGIGNVTTVTIQFHATVSDNMYWKEGGWDDYAPKGMPDFDQKQDQWDHPAGSGQGWYYCGPVAAANSLWWFDSKFEPNPISPPKINDGYPIVQAPAAALYDDHSPANVQNFVNLLALNYMGTAPPGGTNVNNLAAGIAQLLANVGLSNQYTVTTPPVPQPLFEWVEDEVRRSEDVILLLGFYQDVDPDPTVRYWERVGGHFVTVAGIDSQHELIAFSDPYYDRAEAGAPWVGRVLPAPHTWLHPGSPTGEVHNDAKYASHDVYQIVPTTSPGGTWGPEEYVDPQPSIGCPQIGDFQGQNTPDNFFNQPCNPQAETLTTEVEYAVAVSPITKTVTCNPTTNIAVVSGAMDVSGMELAEVQAHTRVRILQQDWGDAPDPTYPTLRASNGAVHTIRPGFHLGKTVDGEPNGQPNATALGDDQNILYPGVAYPPGDEDGVAFTAPLVPGRVTTVVVTASLAGALDAWIDYNRSGAWEHPAEHLFGGASRTVSAGANHITVTVPSTATVGLTFARFRLSAAGGLLPTGPAPDGEVEDYRVRMHDPTDYKWTQPYDPSLSGLHTHDWLSGTIFGQTGADDWQCHGGVITDLEWWGNYELDIYGAERRNSGIAYFHLSVHASHPVTPSIPGSPIWQADVPFTVLSETPVGITNPEGSPIYHYRLDLNPPVIQVPGGTYWFDVSAHSVNPSQPAIWRWQESSRNAPFQGLHPAAYCTEPPACGWSSTVSDMAFVISSAEADLGDAPDTLMIPRYPTLLANNGAAHALIANGPFMGARVDAEMDGQPDQWASGDDSNGDDEDGVTFTSALVPGRTATVSVDMVSSPVTCLLNAWIDFNRDSDWTDASEQIFTDMPLTLLIINNLTFTVPSAYTQTVGVTYARFRCSTQGGLAPGLAAPDGEVEDYQVEITAPPRVPIVTAAFVSVTTLRLSWPRVAFDIYGNSRYADAYLIFRNTTPYWTPAPGSQWMSLWEPLPDPVTQVIADLSDPSVHHFYIVRAVYQDINAYLTESANSNRTGEFEFKLVPGSP